MDVPEVSLLWGFDGGDYVLIKCLFWKSFGEDYEDVWCAIKCTGVNIMATGQ